MRAEDIIEAMVYDSAVAECAGTVRYYSVQVSPYEWAKTIFDAKLEADDIMVDGASYLYMYGSDMEQYGLEWFLKNNKPNARLRDRENDIIYLWRIDK